MPYTITYHYWVYQVGIASMSTVVPRHNVHLLDYNPSVAVTCTWVLKQAHPMGYWTLNVVGCTQSATHLFLDAIASSICKFRWHPSQGIYALFRRDNWAPAISQTARIPRQCRWWITFFTEGFWNRESSICIPWYTDKDIKDIGDTVIARICILLHTIKWI